MSGVGNFEFGSRKQSASVGCVQILSCGLRSANEASSRGRGSIAAGHDEHDPSVQRQQRPCESIKSNDSLSDEINAMKEPKRRAATKNWQQVINFVKL